LFRVLGAVFRAPFDQGYEKQTHPFYAAYGQ
jgi:hypothetical protein